MNDDHFYMLQIILAAISFVVNGSFLVVLAGNKDLVKRKRITSHVANLAVADTVFGFSRTCYFIVRLHPIELKGKKSGPLFSSMCYGSYSASLIAVLLMSIERSIVIAKPLTWNKILPRKRMSLFIICSWTTVTLLAVLDYLLFKKWNDEMVMFILQLIIQLFAAAVNIYMFKNLRGNNGPAHSQHKSIHLKHKASILVLWLAVIMIVTCLPNSIRRLIGNICDKYKLYCNMHVYLMVYKPFFIMESLNFLVNPLVYIWKDKMYRNAFYHTFQIKKQF